MKGIVTRVEQRITNEYGARKSVIYMWVRGTDKRRYLFIDPNFEPYCYLKPGALHLASFPEVKSQTKLRIKGRDYIKVVTKLPTHVAKLRNIAEHRSPYGVVVYEGDVVFPLRYLIDKKIRGSIEWATRAKPHPLDEDLPSNLRIFMIDIEKLGRSIKCLTIWDSYKEHFYTFYWDPKPITIIPEDDWTLNWFPSEKEMFLDVFKFIRYCDPDVITGYNVDFDLVNIRNRALELFIGDSWDTVSPIWKKEEVPRFHMPPPRKRRKKFRDFWITGKHQRIPGRNIVDLLEILLKTEKHQLAEFNLDYVARNYLSPPMQKHTWKGLKIGPNLDKIWPVDPVAVLRYNKHDVEIIVELNRQQYLLAFADELRKFIGCQLDDIFSNKRIAHIELLRKTSKPLPVTKKEKRSYKGAIVIEPKKGVYRWIIVMDFRSLYPSIILQLNIDPETYVPKTFRKSARYNRTNCFILKDPDSGTEFWFRKYPEGDLPAILRNYLELRAKKRKQMKKLRNNPTKDNLALAEVLDTQQIALKVITNAFYGSLLYRGTPSAYQCARAITACAREAIRFGKGIIEKMGYTVIYGDSISPETSVIFKRKNNIYIMPIERIYRELMEDSLFLRKEKDYLLLDSKNPSRNIEILTINEKGKLVWRKVTQLIRHKTNKPLFKITTKYGIIRVTGDHSLICFEKGKFKEIKPWEITQETKLVHGQNLPRIKGKNHIDLANYLNFNYETEKGWIWKLTKSRKNIKTFHRARIPFKRLWEKKELKKFCWFLGFFIAEGSTTTKGRIMAKIANQNKQLIEKMRKIQKLMTGRQNKLGKEIDKRTGKEIFYLNLSSRIEFDVLRQLCGSNAFTKKIPSFIFNLEKKYLKEFLKGYNSGVGTKNVLGSQFEFGTSSYELANGLIFLLKRLEYFPTIGTRKDKEYYRIRAQKGKFFKEDTEIYNDLILTKVKDISIEKNPGLYVYDLEIPKNHKFIAGEGLFLVHNTDSIMIQSKFDYEDSDLHGAMKNYKMVIGEAEQISKKVAQEMPKFLLKLAAHGQSELQLALDKVFERFLIDEKKKRYAGIPLTKLGRGKLEVKGFGAVRSDTSKFTGNLQKTLIREILGGRRKADIKFIAENMLETYDKISLLEVGVPCVLTKPLDKYKSNPVQKKAFTFSNKYLSGHFTIGDKPKRIYVKPIEEKKPIEVVDKVDVVAFETNLKLPDWLVIDWPRMVEKTVKPKIEKVLQFVDLEWKDLHLKPRFIKKKKKRKKRKKKIKIKKKKKKKPVKKK